MTKEQLGELICYVFRGDKLRCARVIMTAYNLSLEESRNGVRLTSSKLLKKRKENKKKKSFK